MTFHSGSLSLNLTKLNVMTLKVKQKAVDLASCSNLLLKVMVEEVLVVVEVKAAAMALINLLVRKGMTILQVTTAAVMVLIEFLVKMTVKHLVKKAATLRANAVPTISWKLRRCSQSQPVLTMTP